MVLINETERKESEGIDHEPIKFYSPSKPYGWMRNYSKHPVLMLNPLAPHRSLAMLEYPTTEHRFQAMKAKDYNAHLYVATAPTADQSKKRGHEIDLRDGWGENYGDLCWFVMVEALTTKLYQNSLSEKLLQTGKAQIWEDSPVDDVWGIRFRGDYCGKNLLGRAWMQVRYTLRGEG